MNIEVPLTATAKKTNLINGTATESSVLQGIKGMYSLGNYIVELHLVCPNQVTPRSLASEVSLRKKMRMLEAIGMISRVYIHPYGVSTDIFDQSINDANQDQNTVGIVVQLPLPDYLQEVRGKMTA